MTLKATPATPEQAHACDGGRAIRDGYGEGLVELGKQNKDVVVLSADLADSTRAEFFKDKFPDRYIEMGIAEQNMVGVAGGLAIAGKIPFASSFGAFLMRAFDQIRVTVCYGELNVKLCASHNGVTTGEDGASAQMLEDIALMRSLPNMTVVVPCDAIQAKKATIAVAARKGPCYIRTGRAEVPVITKESTPFELGTAQIMRKGQDVTIIACGIMVAAALDAASQLARQNIDARVINLHTIKPMDEQTITHAAKETGAIVTAEEHQLHGGMGSAVAEVLAQKYPTPIEMVGMRDSFGESGKGGELLKKYHMTADDIVGATKRALKRKA